MRAIAQRLLTLPRELARTSQSNFYYSFFLLPRTKRQGITTIYKFCRTIDDIADRELPRRQALDALDEWKSELQLIYSGTPRHTLGQDLLEVIRRFDLPESYFLELIGGVEMDLTHRRYETFEDLYPYCYRVASIVGLICIEIFGYRNPATKSYAVNLGIALQLTNILRDLKEDAARDRIYLPRTDLRQFRFSDSDLLHGVRDARFIALMRFECERARSYFDRARSALTPEDTRSLVAARAMEAIYYRLLERIEHLQYDVFTRRVEVPRVQRLAIALTAWLRTMY